MGHALPLSYFYLVTAICNHSPEYDEMKWPNTTPQIAMTITKCIIKKVWMMEIHDPQKSSYQPLWFHYDIPSFLG